METRRNHCKGGDEVDRIKAIFVLQIDDGSMRTFGIVIQIMPSEGWEYIHWLEGDSRKMLEIWGFFKGFYYMGCMGYMGSSCNSHVTHVYKSIGWMFMEAAGVIAVTGWNRLPE